MRSLLKPPLALAGTGLVLLAVWALWPIRPAAFAPLDAAPSTDVTVANSSPTPALDLAVFDRPVFTVVTPAETPKVAEATPPPPPPPLKLQLLAIERSDEGIYRAVLFDPDADKVITVSTGDTIAGRTVTRVAAEGVVLTLGPVEHALLLRTDRPIGAAHGGRR